MAQGWTIAWYHRFSHVTQNIFPKSLDCDYFLGKLAT